MLVFKVSGVGITAIETEILTSGAHNIYTCQFSFCSKWVGLDKTAVFESRGIRIAVPLDAGDECLIPHEVLCDPSTEFFAGVYGTRGSEVVMPTVLCKLPGVKRGACLGAESKPPPTNVYAEILGTANDAVRIAQSVREDADAGKFDGPPGPAPVKGEDYFTEEDKQEIIQEVMKESVSDEQIQAAVNAYLKENPPEAGVNFETDSTLILKDGILRVNTTNVVEKDNTLPITSAAVEMVVGNIDVLLSTI